MFIEVSKNNGKDYLRLSESYRPPGSKRPMKRIILNIGSLESLDDGKPDYVKRLRESYKKGEPLLPQLLPYVDVNSSKKDNEDDCVSILFPLREKPGFRRCSPKCLADLLLNKYCEELGISQLLGSIKSRSKLEFDLLGFFKLLVFGRILEPASKIATVKQNEKYYAPILKEGYNADNVYDTLDVIDRCGTRIFQAINKALMAGKEGRDTSILFYDVTNVYFEIEQNDPDIIDDNGVVIEEGLRKRGHSKESRPQPITQAGLFIDSQGIPIGIQAFPGNKVDKATMVSATESLVTPLGFERYVFCADRGLCTMGNLAYQISQGMGYLLSKSIKKTNKTEREWILEQEGYTVVTNDDGEIEFKYKSRVVKRNASPESESESGSEDEKEEFDEKVVVFWSRKYYKRELNMMKGFTEFLDKLEDKSKSFTLSASQVKNIRRFLKDEVLESLDPDNDVKESAASEAPSPVESDSPEKMKDGKPEETKRPEEKTDGQAEQSAPINKGTTDASEKKPRRKRLTQEEKDQRAAEKRAETARKKSIKDSRKKRLVEDLKDSNTARKMVDWEKVNKWKDYAGYYQIVTSETEDDDLEIISTYRMLTQIENRFRTMKGTLEARPVYVRTPSHIRAHLYICTIALVIMCLIQNKLKTTKKSEKNSEKAWETGISADRVQAALSNFSVAELPDGYLWFKEAESKETDGDLSEILRTHGINLENRLYTPKEIWHMRGKVKAL